MPLLQWIMQNLGMASRRIIGSGGLTFGGSALTRIKYTKFSYVGTGGISFNGEADARWIDVILHWNYTGTGEIKVGGTAETRIKAHRQGRLQLNFNVGDTVFDIYGHKWTVSEVLYTMNQKKYYITDYNRTILADEADLFGRVHMPTLEDVAAKLNRVRRTQAMQHRLPEFYRNKYRVKNDNVQI